jgi:hypothetical protein
MMLDGGQVLRRLNRGSGQGVSGQVRAAKDPWLSRRRSLGLIAPRGGLKYSDSALLSINYKRISNYYFKEPVNNRSL